MITFIVCVYDRAYLLQRLFNSLEAQLDDDWRVVVADDNSADPLIESLSRDFVSRHSGAYIKSRITEEERYSLCRPAVMVNHALEYVDTDLVTYWGGDNEILSRNLTERVNAFFRANPDKNCAYVDIAYTYLDYDGSPLPLESIRHKIYPGERSSLEDTFIAGKMVGPVASRLPVINPFTILDSCQFFHRTKYAIRWPEDPKFWLSCDAHALQEIARRGGPVYPVGIELPVVINNITPASLTMTESPQKSVELLRAYRQNSHHTS